MSHLPWVNGVEKTLTLTMWPWPTTFVLILYGLVPLHLDLGPLFLILGWKLEFLRFDLAGIDLWSMTLTFKVMNFRFVGPMVQPASANRWTHTHTNWGGICTTALLPYLSLVNQGPTLWPRALLYRCIQMPLRGYTPTLTRKNSYLHLKRKSGKFKTFHFRNHVCT